MRKRTRGEQTTTTHTWNKNIHNWDCSNSDSTITQSYPVLEGEVEVMHDVVTPRFKRRSSQGEVIVSPMSIVRHSTEITPGTFSYYVTDSSSSTPCDYTHTETDCYKALDKFYGDIYMGGVTHDVSTLMTLAGTDAAGAVEEPDFESLVFLGELRETLSFLRNPVKSWHNFVKNAKRDKNRGASKFDRGKTVGEFLSDSWLSYRYGARPLVNEAQKAVQAVHNSVYNVRPTRRTARGFASDSGSYSHSDDMGTSPGIIWTRDGTVTSDCKVRAGVLYEHFASSDTFGVKMREVPSAAWELIPYSFVADWFANVGSYVRAITPKAGVRYLGKWTTVETERKANCTYFASDGGESGGKPRNVTSNGAINATRIEYRKTRHTGIRVGLASKLKPYHGDIGQKRIVDSIALTEQLLRSR